MDGRKSLSRRLHSQYNYGLVTAASTRVCFAATFCGKRAIRCRCDSITYTTKTLSPSRESSTPSFRTFADPGIRDVIGLPEFYGTVPGLEPYNAANNQSGFSGGRVGQWEGRSNMTLPSEIEQEQLTLDINWDLGDSLSVQFLTGYTEQFNKIVLDWDGSQYDLGYDLNQQDNNLFSQEIQFSGSRDRISWVGGAYYWKETSFRRETRNVMGEFLNGTYDLSYVLSSPTLHGSRFPTGFRSCDQIIFGANGNPALGARRRGAASRQWLRSAASHRTRRLRGVWRSHHFAGGDARSCGRRALPRGERLHGTACVHQRRHGPAAALAGSLARRRRPVRRHTSHALAPGAPVEFSYDKVTSRFSLQKTFSDRIMGYVSYAEGFNSGGVATPTIQGVRVLLPYKPQTIETFEVGLRSDLADGRCASTRRCSIRRGRTSSPRASCTTRRAVKCHSCRRRTSATRRPKAWSSSSRSYRSKA